MPRSPRAVSTRERLLARMDEDAVLMREDSAAQAALDTTSLVKDHYKAWRYGKPPDTLVVDEATALLIRRCAKTMRDLQERRLTPWPENDDDLPPLEELRFMDCPVRLREPTGWVHDTEPVALESPDAT